MGAKTKPIVGADPVEELTDSQLDAELDQIEAELRSTEAEAHEISSAMEALQDANRALHGHRNDLRGRQSLIRGEKLARTAPFKRGDIVADDQGVRYRVHQVFVTDGWDGQRKVEAGNVYGIRLTKTGTEAYAKPRQIVSSKPLVKVEEG